VRAGYVPPEEIPKYAPPNRRGPPAAASVTASPEPIPMRKEDELADRLDRLQVKDEPVSVEHKIRALRKKIRQTEQLADRVASGKVVPDADQQQRITRLPHLKEELAAAEHQKPA